MDFLFNPGLFLLSIVSGVAAWATIFYMLATKPTENVRNRWLERIASVHLFRYIGLVALVPTHVDPTPFGWSQAYLSQVAYGDWIASVLAVLLVFAIRKNWSSLNIIAWAFAILGTLDTINAGASIVPQIYEQNLVTPLGWIILTVYVPALVVTEILLFLTLFGKFGQKAVAN